MSFRCHAALALAGLTLLAACTGDADSTLPGNATRPLLLTSADGIPPVDTTGSAVDLADIVFDTFDGGSVALSEASPELIRRLTDAIRPIDAPDYEEAENADEWLEPEDLVVGYVDPDGAAWSFPIRILNGHEIINEELGGEALVVTYCPLCGSGVVYSRSVDGRMLSFSNTSALYENDMVMVDRETGSYWWQVAGEVLVGPLRGSRLRVLPAQTTTWEAWRDQYPSTAVMSRPAGRSYDRDSFANYPEVLDSGRTPFPVSAGVLDDDRLAPSARVVVVEHGDDVIAFATDPARRVEADIGGKRVVIELDGVGAVVTDQNGTALPSRSAFWFSVVSVHPDVVLGP